MTGVGRVLKGGSLIICFSPSYYKQILRASNPSFQKSHMLHLSSPHKHLSSPFIGYFRHYLPAFIKHLVPPGLPQLSHCPYLIQTQSWIHTPGCHLQPVHSLHFQISDHRQAVNQSCSNTHISCRKHYAIKHK